MENLSEEFLNVKSDEKTLISELGISSERAMECYDWVLISMSEVDLISDTLKQAVIEQDFNTTELVFVSYITGMITQMSDEQRQKLYFVAMMKKLSKDKKINK